MPKNIENYDVVVIGGGPAGMTAAIYCGRARLNTLLLEKSLMGGLATYTNEIENYPGFPEGNTGTGLMKLFEQQVKKFGVKIKYAEVTGVELEGETKVVKTFRTDYHAKVVIIATGGKPRLTGAKNEEKFLFGKGISFCSTCDAAYYTGKDVLVVGSGDAAIEESIFLSKFANKIYISVIHDVGIMDANKVAQEQALKNEKLHFIWNTMVDEFVGGDTLETVILRNVKTGEKIPVKVDGCFLFIGYLPNTDIFKGILNMTERGYIITNENMETNIPGVFACGDVREKTLRQVATSVGDGAIAGFMAERYIAETEMFEKEFKGVKGPQLVLCYDPTDALSREKMTVVEEYSKNHPEVKFNKIDVYKGKSMAQRLGIKGEPSLVVMFDGEIKEIIPIHDISATSIDEKLSLL
ncbi:MAG: FAD-dependent oxidoreductase [Thermovenabulum sp.]|uniref:FAD-dependent oxidoreductase n=1 Tax=Thermovenabulum sp. TaxID=3100335 RepID=UPI003C7E1D49